MFCADAVSKGVRTFVVDNLSQMQKMVKFCDRVEVLIRLRFEAQEGP
jgi:diaminopimelate decarboxylase